MTRQCLIHKPYDIYWVQMRVNEFLELQWIIWTFLFPDTHIEINRGPMDVWELLK